MRAEPGVMCGAEQAPLAGFSSCVCRQARQRLPGGRDLAALLSVLRPGFCLQLTTCCLPLPLPCPDPASATQNHTRWQDLLIGKLTDRVKLVGPTISCEGSPYKGNAKGEWRANPHVQSYVLATDQARWSAGGVMGLWCAGGWGVGAGAGPELRAGHGPGKLGLLGFGGAWGLSGGA